jgi:hypothetical protein
LAEKFISKIMIGSGQLGASVVLALNAMSLACVAPVESTGYKEKEALALDCSREILDRLGPMDVVIAFDNSLSSLNPAGIDVDGDGIVGVFRDSTYTDRDDSWLGLQVAVAREVIQDTFNHDIRFSIVTFAGQSLAARERPSTRAVGSRDAKIRAGMTGDAAVLESALDDVIDGGNRGSANFYAGMRRANQSLIESEDPERKSRKVVLFISNTPGPTFRSNSGLIEGTISDHVALAVREAKRHNIIYNTFGLTERSNSWIGLSLGLIAHFTGGSYHAVGDPGVLYCHLVSSMAPASSA